MNKEIKIEKGIPIPASYISSNEYALVFKSMEIGDSFLVSNGREAGRATSTAHNRGIKASYRKQPDGTYRVWRKA